jgi:hypothetical protein
MNEPLIDHYHYKTRDLYDNEKAYLLAFDIEFFPGNLQFELNRQTWRTRMKFTPLYGKVYNILHISMQICYYTVVVNIRLNKVGEVKEPKDAKDN